MSLSTLSDDFDWHGFYEFAEGICERDAKDEIQCRVAIGRLYYSAFNIVREYARDRYGFWSDSNVHSSLIEFFAKNGYDEYDSFSRDLKYLRDYRVDCDYKTIRLRNPEGVLTACRKMSERLIDFVDNASA